MHIVCAARHVDAKVTTATDKDARLFLLVIFTATYSIPAQGKQPRPLLPPCPLALQDTFVDQPGLSAPLLENDLALIKHHCDVIADAHAHSPDGQPRRQLDVGLSVGSMHKVLHVVGHRCWEKDVLWLRAGRPEPFVSMPLHSGMALGGTWRTAQGQSASYAPNPFGQGFSLRTDLTSLYQMPLPTLEQPGFPVRRPDVALPPAYFSVLPRNVPPRMHLAGTYDQQWKEERAPFLPDDFDEAFFQCAPPDQRIPFPQGGEEVLLWHLMPGRAEVRFCLPRLDTVPVRVLHRDYTISEPGVHADTLIFEPDKERFRIVWRARVPLGQRGVHAVRMVCVGQVCQSWWQGIIAGRSGCQGCGGRVQLTQSEQPHMDNMILCPQAPDVQAQDKPIPKVRLLPPQCEDEAKGDPV